MTQQTQSVQRADTRDKDVVFKPFMSDTAIKLNINLVKNLLAVRTRTGRTCSDNDAVKFIMMCQARGLNPWEGDAFLVGYDTNQNGTIVPSYSLITSHQALLKRAEVHPDFEGMESGIVLLKESETGEITVEDRETDFHLPEERVVGGWARVHIRNKRPVFRKIRLARFFKDMAQWKVDPAGMICKCAEADALRSAFPTKLGGMYLRTEGGSRVTVDVPAADVSVTPESALVALPGPGESGEGEPEPGEPEKQPTQPDPEQRKATLRQPKNPAPGKSARAELAQFVISEGFTFTHLQRWALETGNISGVDSMENFDSIPEADAQRLLRSKEGLKTGMIKYKEGGQ